MNSSSKITGSRTVSKNTKKKPSKKKSGGFLGFLKIFLIVAVIVGVVGTLGVYFYIMNVLKDVEPIDPDLISSTLTENSVIVDANGKVLEQIQLDGLRTVVRYDEMSDVLVNAFIAVEDKTFRTHNGFNIVRMIGAVVDSVTSGDRIGGTSTITQQLARNIYLPEKKDERSLDRKIKEAYYAIELEKYLTKNQIIEAYLNYISLGSNANGVESAAQRYFSKHASELDYIEAAMLAGIPKAPGQYSPMINKNKGDVTEDDYILDDSDPLYTLVFNENSVNRYLTSIYLMHENGYISDAEYDYAKTYDIRQKLHPGVLAETEITSYFADMVEDEVISDLIDKYGYTSEAASNLLYTGGLTIVSTIDFDMQKTLESHYAKNNLTTYFGESTATVIKAFQRDNGLTVDGYAGQNTLAKIGELSGTDMSQFTQDVYQKGDDSDEVVLLKQILYDLGYVIGNENFPKITVRLDSSGNILSEETQKILLYKKSNLVNSSEQLIIPSSDYQFDADGNLVLLKNKRFYFYSHTQTDGSSTIQIVVRETYTYDGEDPNSPLSAGKHTLSDIYTYSGHDLTVGNDYKSYDENGNVVIDKSFLAENPDFFKASSDGSLLVENGNYTIDSTGVIQPQSAMVIIDYHTGELKAIVGGRNVTGQRIYNRATNPRQPGSSIKPLSIFTPAIDTGAFTAASVLDDRPVYLSGDSTTRWPVNWYENSSNYRKYWGLVNLRESLQWSINVTAALISQELGIQTSVDYLERFGITSVVKEGDVNDMNTAAMALGGMTKGISPIELTSAYGAIANGGVRNEVTTYSVVKNSKGEVILENTSEQTYVIDENVAYIVQDMMMTSVKSGVATAAKLSPNNDIMPVAGKTGTTTSNMDAWFVGYTPYYVGGTWFGNDLNFPLDQGSKMAAQFWKTVMSDIHADLESKSFVEPSGIVRVAVDRISGKLPTELSYLDPRGTVYTELFLRGTEPTEEDDVHVLADICTASDKLATEYCPTTLIESQVVVKRPVPYNPEENLDGNGNPILLRDSEYDMPTELCDVHTAENTTTFPTTDPNDPTSYYGIQPMVQLVNGQIIIQRPYPITMVGGQVVVVPAGTRILKNDDLLLPDGSKINASDIDEIPNYSSDELDQMNLIP